ncbi:hypothetical protein C2U54_10825 [Leclercia sp. LSNIH1]|nr:hypothetical protein C2U54_10825 [Leclercia sp. LSNIH1]POV35449.1 hypothetical protein C3388_08600 [Leclercia sp. LSNIH5]POW67720.1 hypothetical protein C3389_07425 [Leclercia sp. LSNIH2]
MHVDARWRCAYRAYGSGGVVPCGLMPGGAALTGPTVRAGVGFVGRVRRSRHPAHSTALNRGNLLPEPA